MPMTAAEIAARLALINAQIDALLSDPVEQLTVGARSAKMRDLDQLERQRDKYEAELANVNAGGRAAVTLFQKAS